MTNPLHVRSSFVENFLVSIFTALIAGLIGGFPLMWLTEILMPVGLGYWASASSVVLSRALYGLITKDVDD